MAHFKFAVLDRWRRIHAPDQPEQHEPRPHLVPLTEAAEKLRGDPRGRPERR